MKTLATRLSPTKSDNIAHMPSFTKSTLLVVLSTLLSGCGQLFELVYCDYGYGGVENQFYQTGVNLLDKCLALEHLDVEQRSKYLQGRAWAHYNLENNQQALADQEAAFALKRPTQHYEFINHAAYLRRLERFHDSLRVIRSALEIDELNGQPNMVTQYNLGWTLYELNRFDEALVAFTRGIEFQPDYAFIYLRRGLAFYKQGEGANAKQDFAEFLNLVGEKQVNIPAALKKEISELPSEYSNIRNL